eukprot:scaffold2215_cov162-Amphora_coffeaeformis.AAC.2
MSHTRPSRLDSRDIARAFCRDDNPMGSYFANIHRCELPYTFTRLCALLSSPMVGRGSGTFGMGIFAILTCPG